MAAPQRMWLIAICLVGSSWCGAAGAGTGKSSERPEGQEEIGMADTSIMAAQKALTDSLITKSGVVGTAIGLCEAAPCIKVYIARRDEELLKQIPDTFMGFRVDVEVTGEFRARDTTS